MIDEAGPLSEVLCFEVNVAIYYYGISFRNKADIAMSKLTI
jgi:hypothetical protein